MVLRAFSFVFCVVATGLSWSSLRGATSWTASDLGKAAIYYSKKDAPPPPRKGVPPLPDILLAAQDLQEYVKKMTGVEVPLQETDVVSGIPSGAPAFVLGGLARELGAEPPRTEFAEDGYVLEMKDGRLLIAGEGDRGTAYGVADFLYRQGVRFYMPGPYGEEVPSRESLLLPAERIVGKPDWEERSLWLNGGSANRFAEVAPDVPRWFGDWQRHNRVGSATRLPTGHMWGSIFRTAGITREEALKQHPDWFAEVNGERNPRQLNLLNEEVVDLFVNHFKKQLADQPREVARVLSISPDDQVLLNQDADARSWMANRDIIFTHLPDATDYLIQFNNRVIRKLNAEYPNVRLAFYIYSNYQNAPTKVAMDKNLIAFLAPLNFSRYHALTDATKPNRALLANIVKRWHKQDAALGWRDYSFLCPDAMMPFTRLHMTRRDIPWLHEHGVRYLSLETISNWPNLLPELHLLTRLLWDVKLDQEAELKEFYTRFFGPAAEPMKAYITEVSEAYNALPFSSGNKEFVASIFTPERLGRLRGQLEHAKAQAAGNAVVLHRIGILETAFRQAVRFVAMREAVNRFDYPTAEKFNAEILQAFDDDLKFDPNTNTMFVREAWYRRFYGDQVRKIKDWMEGAEILHVFPDEWPAHFDFTKTGEAEELSYPASSGFDLFSLKTYSRSLAEQGWEKFRGDIWYRQRFPAPKIPAGKQLFLVFGGVDRFLKVWVNGTLIGEGTGARAFDPVFLPVEPGVLVAGENTLTVRVNNESPNELGVGGLLRPVALIAK